MALPTLGFCLLLMSARRYYPLFSPAMSNDWLSNLMQPKGDIPYGVAIAIGALMALPESGVVAAYVAGR